MNRRLLSVLSVLGLFVTAAIIRASAEEASVQDDGSVQLPSVKVPFSNLASSEAKQQFILGIRKEQEDAKTLKSSASGGSQPSITQMRQWVDETMAKPWVRLWRAKFPVTIVPTTIGGVQTDVIEPEGGVAVKNRKRVLIELHGGGLVVGARYHGQAESIPIASVGKIKVITVDYRMAPEHHYPAASDDVVAVYKALLKQYRPRSIGIYGCSAGAYLTADSVAWFEKEHLPLPGAMAMFGEGAGYRIGDSAFIAPALHGSGEMPDPKYTAYDEKYFSSVVDRTDPLLFPAESLEILKRFPPVLLISGTRDVDLSDVIHMDTQLTKAGAQSELHVWEGMGHCFLIAEDVPESHDAWNVVVRFFDSHLGK